MHSSGTPVGAGAIPLGPFGFEPVFDCMFELATAARLLLAATDPAGVYAAAKSEARRLVGADGVSIVRREGEHCHYVDEEAIGPLWKGKRFPLTACISGWVILHGQTVVLEDIYADARIPHEAYRSTFVQSLVMAPLGTVAPSGAIGCYWAHRHQASEREVRLIEQLASVMDQALRRLAGVAPGEATGGKKIASGAENRSLLEAALQAAPVFIVVTDDEGRIRQLNRAAEELTGRSAAELTGWKLSDLAQAPALTAMPPSPGDAPALPRLQGSHRRTWRTVRGERRTIEWHGTTFVSPQDGSTCVLLTGTDVTVQERAAGLFEQFFEYSAVMNCILDSRRRILRSNAASSEITGYLPTELVGMSVGRLLVRPERANARVLLAALRAGEAVVNQESCIRCKDGQERWLLWTAVPLPQQGITLLGARDVTERRNIMHQLRDRERQLQTFLHFNPAIIFIKDRTGRYLKVNRAFEEHFGLEAVKVVGRHDSDLFSPAQAEQFLAHDRRVLATEEAVECEETTEHPGGPRLTLAQRFPLRNTTGEIYGIGGIASDITELRQTNERLRQQARFIADVLDSLSAHVAVLDPRGTILAVNQAWRRFAEQNGSRDANAYTGSNYLEVCRRVTGAGAAQARAVLNGVRAVLAGRRKSFSLEYPCHGPDGPRWFLVRTSPLVGPLTGAVVAHEDITQRKRATDSVQRIAEVVAEPADAGFMDRIARALAAISGNEHATIGELLPDGQHIRVVAAHSPIIPAGMTYQLAGTPCENVVGRDACYYADGVARLFPADLFLAEHQIESYAGMPLWDSRKRPLGLVVLLSHRPLAEPELTVALMRIVATRVAGEIERSRSDQQLRQMTGNLLRSQDHERRVLGRELHDSTAQALAALEINLAALAKQAAALSPTGQRLLQDAQELAGQCTSEIRALAYALRPPLLDELGLVPALRVLVQGFARRSGIRCRFHATHRPPALRPEAELALFRVTQEALANVHRHSGSDTAEIRLTRTKGALRLAVIDHGLGLGRSRPRRPVEFGVGLTGMQERLHQLDGALELRSNSRGTRVIATLPCPPEQK